MRIAKTIDCVQSVPGECQRRPSLNAWMKPMQSAPSTAPGQVADAAEHGRGERDQAELEAGVVAHLLEVEGVDEARRAGEAAGDQERERDRAVDVDAHHRGGVAVLRGRAHRLALPRALDEPHEQRQSTGMVIRTTMNFSHV